MGFNYGVSDGEFFSVEAVTTSSTKTMTSWVRRASMWSNLVLDLNIPIFQSELRLRLTEPYEWVLCPEQRELDCDSADMISVIGVAPL